MRIYFSRIPVVGHGGRGGGPAAARLIAVGGRVVSLGADVFVDERPVLLFSGVGSVIGGGDGRGQQRAAKQGEHDRARYCERACVQQVSSVRPVAVAACV